MGLYANAAAGCCRAQLLHGPGAARRRNQTLRVRLFDIGDCGGCTGSPTLTFKKPGGANWDSCKVRVGDTNSVHHLLTLQLPDTANGLWTTVDIADPGHYTCTVATATDCWTTMTYALAGAGRAERHHDLVRGDPG